MIFLKLQLTCEGRHTAAAVGVIVLRVGQVKVQCRLLSNIWLFNVGIFRSSGKLSLRSKLLALLSRLLLNALLSSEELQSLMLSSISVNYIKLMPLYSGKSVVSRYK